MRRTTLITLALLIILSAPTTGIAQDPDWVKELAPKRIVYSVPGMNRVRVKRDVMYKRVAGAELKMDVYTPRGARNSPRPAVIFIHGGRIPENLRATPKDWGAYVSFGQLVAASGFVGVTFNHRFYAWESLADSQADLIDLIAYVREHAAGLGVDRERIVLWSVSAGSIFLSQPLRERPPYIRCVVAYYSELDLQGERASVPQSVTDETLREFSPLYHLSAGGKGFPPLFVARAGLDDPGLNAGIDRFVQAALARNLTVEVVNHATGHHGFDVEDNNDRSREIIRRTLEFIRSHS